MDASRGKKNLRLRLRPGFFVLHVAATIFVMKTGNEEQSVEEEWQAAQAALNDAQKLPGGPERVEALKRAG